ncbi:MAG: GAF domain-containing protein [Euryarchaeota archaeon]|nr:GAF domain-containing protein [Euryarchaeota archaeon]
MKKRDKILEKIKKIVEEEQKRDKKLQLVCELLRREGDHYDWVGFYLVENGTLVLGPFVGEPTEHVRIPFGEGICGQAADREETFVVQDVSKETNYLACSPKVQSEMVVPIFKNGKVVGELDIDSHIKSPFTEKDRELLERICGIVASLF